MSIAFTCPECEARMEVPDDHAGLSGQCPRCKHVFVIPSASAPQKPRVVASAAQPPPIPEEKVDVALPRRGRRTRRELPPPPPRGPAWPWLVGIPAFLAVASILFAALMVLSFYRKSPAPRPSIANLTADSDPGSDGVLRGKLEGKQVHLAGGEFAIRSIITPTDPVGTRINANREKRYTIELQQGKRYTISAESTRFDPFVELRNPAGQVMRSAGAFGNNKAHLEFDARDAGVYTLHASSMNQGLGLFTLMITERDPDGVP